MLIKNAGIAYILELVNAGKPYIIPRLQYAVSYTHHLKNIATVSFIDIVSFYIVIHFISIQTINSRLLDSILFIPHSFCFELVFDFCHYWFHRLLHTNKQLYKYIHSHHHSNSKITVYSTFEQNPIDLLLTNMIPICISATIIPSTPYFIFLFFWYKTFLEISGHLGKENKGLSFPQCVWIPKYLGICLKSKNHNYHHTKPMKNFGKRFSIWDKVFGTFEE